MVSLLLASCIHESWSCSFYQNARVRIVAYFIVVGLSFKVTFQVISKHFLVIYERDKYTSVISGGKWYFGTVYDFFFYWFSSYFLRTIRWFVIVYFYHVFLRCMTCLLLSFFELVFKLYNYVPCRHNKFKCGLALNVK